MKNLDGRKLRWLDCNWNNADCSNHCGDCRVCTYLDYLEEAESVAPKGSLIERGSEVEVYLKLGTNERAKNVHTLLITE